MATQKRKSRGFGEGQAVFVADLGRITELLAAYDFRCAFTGEDLKPLVARDPMDALLRLAGPQAPQYLDADLLVPAVPEITDAYRRGHLAVGRDFHLLLDWERIDRTLANRLGGSMRLPSAPEFIPNRLVLEEHRVAFAAGSFPSD